MGISRVGKTALGATAFLALESIAAAVTINYGFVNTIAAMLVVAAVFFITGFPIAYYSAKHGLDIDLLTRGAGFGYLGSTVTSLIYASFTFIFFAIEAAILASALHALLGIPLSIGYFICAVAVIPIVIRGITTISRFQVGTQTLWLLLQIAAIATVIIVEYDTLPAWTDYQPKGLSNAGEFNWLLFGAAASVFFALVAQIGEQVDYLRFLPPKTEQNKKKWWFWLVLSGPGWIFIGLLKMLFGSFIAYIAITEGATYVVASDPTYMYERVFNYLTNSPSMSLILAAVMVIICQMKINVTNAYAGSIAWSNFFSRATHSHPGRVVWLVFNVTIALILMELGVHEALEAILGVFAIVAVSWLGSLTADLLINKPLGLSPSYIEFKRGHLYDVNPVGTVSMVAACILGLAAYLGVFGETSKNLSHFISLLACFIFVPLIAYITKGKYYLARQSPELIPIIEEAKTRASSGAAPSPYPSIGPTLTCGVCDNDFEVEDMSYCGVYAQPICSLCCSLDVRCLDSCKPHARLSRQVVNFLRRFMPGKLVRSTNSRLGRFAGLLIITNMINAAMLALVYEHMMPSAIADQEVLKQSLITLFFIFLIVTGVISWLFLLAHESRVVAQIESNRQTRKLMREIQAHEKTDLELQQAKEHAEQANDAKSRYLSGISHELRTPLQSILGYAQLLTDKQDLDDAQSRGLNIIHRSGLHLADLIEGLLDISKIEAGRLDLFRNKVQLPELLDQLASMFQMQAKNKGIELNFNIEGRLPKMVMADEKRLRQVLINVLSNAVKYTQEGSIDFTVKYRSQVAEFIIKDTGPGIEASYLARIFEPFERVRNTHTPNVQGTGLGLTIVKLLTEVMGGELQVDSELGKGSCFKVSLMLPWVNNTQQVEEAVKAKIVGYEGYQRTICLVDDDPVLRGFLSDLLIPLGFTTLEAFDAPSCMALLDTAKPDLFVLDVSMPGKTGYELADDLRSEGISVPILMLSANAQMPSSDYIATASYSDYLIKPINNAALLDKLAEHLGLHWISQNESEDFDSVKVLSKERDGNPEEAQTSDAFVIPNDPLIRELKAYAEMGYRKGVVQTLAQVESAKLLPEPFMQSLFAMSDSFQFDQLAQALRD
ncbi:hybrid sensor histidine kinase/response regulator [Oleiphilus sp. HI0069]|nr:hybrid sensor histidine kinase/response regulator [Oleiphilus sp. HI0069]